MPNKKPYPVYQETPDAEIRPGMYLCLFNGSKGLDRRAADLCDWGFNGPMIGPLEFVHTTYANHVKIRFVDVKAAIPFVGTELFKTEEDFCCGMDYADPMHPKPVYDFFLELFTLTECIIFDGDQYGDWTVYNHPQNKR